VNAPSSAAAGRNDPRKMVGTSCSWRAGIALGGRAQHPAPAIGRNTAPWFRLTGRPAAPGGRRRLSRSELCVDRVASCSRSGLSWSVIVCLHDWLIGYRLSVDYRPANSFQIVAKGLQHPRPELACRSMRASEYGLVASAAAGPRAVRRQERFIQCFVAQEKRHVMRERSLSPPGAVEVVGVSAELGWWRKAGAPSRYYAAQSRPLSPGASGCANTRPAM